MKHKNNKYHYNAVMGAGLFLAVLLGTSAWHAKAVAAESPDTAAVQECLLKALESAPGATTVDELRTKCRAEKMTAAKEKDKGIIEHRLYTDDDNVLRPFTLMAHRPNYILLANYNGDPNNEPWREATGDPDLELDNVEAQFQVSIKVPLAVDLFND